MNVVNIRLPALRERCSDLPALSQFFIDKFSEQNGMDKKEFLLKPLPKFWPHHWRGNIRELENTMHRAVLVSMEDEIEADAVHIAGMEARMVSPPAATAPAATGVSSAETEKTVPKSGRRWVFGGKTIADVERQMILNTLDHCLGNRTHAANILGFICTFTEQIIPI